MKVSAKKVSVCIPAFNHARFLPQAIDSVLAQTYRDYELIIVDDASDDNSCDIIRKYKDQDERINCSRNETNLGMVRNWNRCLDMAQGEYVKFLFGDDYFSTRSVLESMVGRLEEDRSASLVTSARNYVDENSNLVKVLSPFGSDGVYNGKQVVRQCLLLQKNLVGEPSAVMFRREEAERGFDVKYRQLVDLEMWFHLLEQGCLVYIDSPLCSFRIHSGQQTVENVRREVEIEDTHYLYREYLNKPYLKIPGFVKSYLQYDYYYGKWRCFVRGRADLKAALDRIRPYGLAKFFSFFPLYMLVMPLVRLTKSVAGKRLMSERSSFRPLGGHG